MRLTAFAALLLASVPAAAHETVEVSVPGGIVEGEVLADGVVFRGVPYAAPPLADRRWLPPQPVVPWTGTRDATAMPPACPQVSEGWNEEQSENWSEDCLTLDIRTTSLEGKRPVLVWIHGGSNRAGSASGPADSDLTKQGVVAVGIQYRLGLLGYLSHPELSEEGGGHSGNYALMDQVAALEWVRDNIASFGGDPDRVTIVGESAGSQDVSLMLSTPLADGLMDAAIMQSGTPGFGLPWRTLEEAEAMGAVLGDIETLRAMDMDELLQLQVDYEKAAGWFSPFLRTTLDGHVLPEAPDALLAKRTPLPVIIGTDKVEFAGSDEASVYEPQATFFFNARAADALEIYRSEQADPRRGTIGTRIVSDAIFHCPSDRLATLLARNGWPVWRYEFDIGPDGGFTRHAYEVSWVFERKPIGSGAFMQDYWAALAVSGDPNSEAGAATARPSWAKWNPDKPRQLVINHIWTAMDEGAPRAGVCDLLEAY